MIHDFPALRSTWPEEILNLQARGALAKAYQVRQVLEVIVQYGLAEDDDAE
jgi:hypothetical protein